MASMQRKRPGVGLAALVVVVTGALAVAGFVLLSVVAWPFGTHTSDKSAPALLTQLENLSRYEAARANFTEIVDVSHDVDHVPDTIAGERAQLKAVGSVPAYVEFNALDKGAVKVDGKKVTITLPHATLGDPALDQKQTEVINHERGLLNRIADFVSSNPGDEQELYVKAGDKMRDAAAQSDLQSRAEENTRQMLTGMMRSMGYTDVTVNFADSPA